MDPRMNRYNGCQPSYQYGGFGYAPQQQQWNHNQGPYANNQGEYHHQQWNNNYQDPSSYSSQSDDAELCRLMRKVMDDYNEINERLIEIKAQREEYARVLDSGDEMMESPIEEKIDKDDQRKEDERIFSSQSQATSTSSSQHQDTRLAEAYELLRETANERNMLLAMNEKLDKKVKKLKAHRESDQKVLERLDEMMEMMKRMLEESSDSGDSNEPTPETSTMEMCNLPKVKESLRVLLDSDYIGESLSKVEHLKFILDNKEMLGEVLQEYEEEQGSHIHIRTTCEEASSLKKKEIIRINDMIQVEKVVKTTDEIIHDPPLVLEQRETLKPMPHAKKKKKKNPKPSPLTFKPLRFIDGKLECKVYSKGKSKPFSRVKILFEPSLKGDNWGTVNEAMAKIFGMKLDDRGPLYQSKSLIPPNG